MLSNYLIKTRGRKDDLLRKLENHIANYVRYNKSVPGPEVTAKLGDWSVAWGPALFQAEDSHVSDNGMMVLRSSATFPDGSTKDTYVVAIAGTAAMSVFDWEHEDGIAGDRGAAIRDVVSWSDFVATPSTTVTPHPAAGQPYISHGTATGLVILLGMRDPASNLTLTQYLATIRADVLVVTGHSLGGALSAGLGLYLAQSRAVPGIATTYVYPTAGASPGNDGFAKRFSETLPPVPVTAAPTWRSWNRDIWNSLDIVPQAWSTAQADPTKRTLRNVNGIYGNRPDCHPTPLLVAYLSKRLTTWSTESQVVYTPIEGACIPGHTVTQVTDTPKTVTLTVPPADLRDFLEQALYQHSTAYADAIFGDDRLPVIETPFVDGIHDENRADLIAFFMERLTAGAAAEEPESLDAAE